MLALRSVSCAAVMAVASASWAQPAETPAWAAEATMNPDYVTAADTATGSESTAGGAQGSTQYYGTAEKVAKPAWAAEATMNPDYSADAVQTAEGTPSAANGGGGATQYYGVTDRQEAPAWAAEATMNPDYAGADAAAEQAKTGAAASSGGEGVTQFFGTSAAGEKPAWAAEAAMNPDYATAPAARETAQDDAPASTGGEGVTQFFGTAQSGGQPAWAAEAAMNPDYAATEPTQTTPQTTTRQAAAVCQTAVNAEMEKARLAFRLGSTTIVDAAETLLDRIAKIINDCGDVFVEVGGYTDNAGRAEENQRLSERRAQRVMRYLVEAGVPAGRLKAVGHGQDNPVASNDTAEGRSQNRRVEFLITEGASG